MESLEWNWISEGGLDFFSIFVLSYYRANDSGTNKTNKTNKQI